MMRHLTFGYLISWWAFVWYVAIFRKRGVILQRASCGLDCGYGFELRSSSLDDEVDDVPGRHSYSGTQRIRLLLSIHACSWNPLLQFQYSDVLRINDLA